MNHWFPLPFLQERGTIIPLEEVGGHGGTWDDLGVEAPTTHDELEGNVAKVEAKVSCLPLVPVACLYGGGGSRCKCKAIHHITSKRISTHDCI